MMNLFTLPNGTVVNLFKAISVSKPIHRTLQNKFIVEIHFDGQPDAWEYDLYYHRPQRGLDTPLGSSYDVARRHAERIYKEIIECWAE